MKESVLVESKSVLKSVADDNKTNTKTLIMLNFHCILFTRTHTHAHTHTHEHTHVHRHSQHRGADTGDKQACAADVDGVSVYSCAPHVL